MEHMVQILQNLSPLPTVMCPAACRLSMISSPPQFDVPTKPTQEIQDRLSSTPPPHSAQCVPSNENSLEVSPKLVV